MRIVPLIPGVVLLAALWLPAAAQAQVYSWRDASGKIHYSDRPPAARQGEHRKLPSPPQVNAEAKRSAFLEKQQKEQEKRKEQGEAAAKQKEQRAEEAKRQENCRGARSNLSALESGLIRFVIGADGERQALEGTLREREIARARQLVAEWCDPPAPRGR